MPAQSAIPKFRGRYLPQERHGLIPGDLRLRIRTEEKGEIGKFNREAKRNLGGFLCPPPPPFPPRPPTLSRSDACRNSTSIFQKNSIYKGPHCHGRSRSRRDLQEVSFRAYFRRQVDDVEQKGGRFVPRYDTPRTLQYVSIVISIVCDDDHKQWRCDVSPVFFFPSFSGGAGTSAARGRENRHFARQ